MCQQLQHFLISACGSLLVVCIPARIHAADNAGPSTIRTVSVSGEDGKASAGRSIELPQISNASKPRFTQPGAATAGTSSINFVAASVHAKPAEQHWVRQAQFTFDGAANVKPAATASTSARGIPPAATAITEAATRTTVVPNIASIEPSDTTSAPIKTDTAEPLPARAPRPAFAAPAAFTRPQYDSQPANPSPQIVDYFGANAARATLRQLPRRTPVRPAPSPAPRLQGKPFQSIEHEPTVSPYLNLHREESDSESAPNYHAFVRPQLEQLEASRRQQLEIQRLQRQMQTTSSTVAKPQHRAAVAIPNAGTAARYMDTAQFYGAWQR